MQAKKKEGIVVQKLIEELEEEKKKKKKKGKTQKADRGLEDEKEERRVLNSTKLEEERRVKINSMACQRPFLLGTIIRPKELRSASSPMCFILNFYTWS